MWLLFLYLYTLLKLQTSKIHFLLNVFYYMPII